MGNTVYAIRVVSKILGARFTSKAQFPAPVSLVFIVRHVTEICAGSLGVA